jgi:hypothetical protein
MHWHLDHIISKNEIKLEIEARKKTRRKEREERERRQGIAGLARTTCHDIMQEASKQAKPQSARRMPCSTAHSFIHSLSD